MPLFLPSPSSPRCVTRAVSCRGRGATDPLRRPYPERARRHGGPPGRGSALEHVVGWRVRDCASPWNRACSCPAAVPSSRRTGPRARPGRIRRRGPVLRFRRGRRRPCRRLGQVELHAAEHRPGRHTLARHNVGAFAGKCTPATCSRLSPARLRGRSDILRPMCRTSPPTRSVCCPWRPVSTSRWSPSTAVRTGLDILREVAAGAPSWLAPGGCLLVEGERTQTPVSRRGVHPGRAWTRTRPYPRSCTRTS